MHQSSQLVPRCNVQSLTKICSAGHVNRKLQGVAEELPTIGKPQERLLAFSRQCGVKQRRKPREGKKESLTAHTTLSRLQKQGSPRRERTWVANVGFADGVRRVAFFQTDDLKLFTGAHPSSVVSSIVHVLVYIYIIFMR